MSFMGIVYAVSRTGVASWGTYHFSGAPACSWARNCLENFPPGLSTCTKIPHMWDIASVEYPTPAERPAWSVMDCSKLLKILGIAKSDWRTDLIDVLVELVEEKVVRTGYPTSVSPAELGIVNIRSGNGCLPRNGTHTSSSTPNLALQAEI